ncbi:hypothetical protein SLE2022_179950 [Rubroshorea leprosula]
MIWKWNSEKNQSRRCNGTDFQRILPTGIHCSSGRRERAVIILIIFLFIFVASILSGDYYRKLIIHSNSIRSRVEKTEFPLQCNTGKQTQECPMDYPTTHNPADIPDPKSSIICPSYFRWIHEDLRPWKDTGITRDMVKEARKTAHFRLVIKNGKAYVEKYKKSIQTRDVFTLWGILQLLRWYPGRLPDLELMFDCDDRPVVPSQNFKAPKARPPPLFRYCSDEWSLDIVFPDWSFWGWAETNIRPWKDLLEDIKQGNNRTTWKERAPYAYWRGNPSVAGTRQDLMKCNTSDKNDWNTHLYIQDWVEEMKQGFKESNIEDQCTHRYKIYTEGWAWSVSEKYILACDSMTLYIKSRYHDFFIRGMQPLQHYWPIRDNSKCTSLKFAVEWGNIHLEKAEAIGKAGANFIHEDMKMDYIYDYMFHLLNEYAKLLRFKPKVPRGATMLCAEIIMACHESGNWKKFKEESLVTSPRDTVPCAMPPPYNATELREFLDTKANSVRQVETWENEYWQNINKRQ